MSEKYKFTDPAGVYFVTMTIVGWVDLFTRRQLRHVIIESLKYCQKEKGLVIHAWCLMPSHLHMIVSTKKEGLSGIMRDFKTFTSKEMVKVIQTNVESRRGWVLDLFSEVADHLKRNRKYKVWQDGVHAELLYSDRFIKQKLRYVHNNPMVDEVVDEPEHYRYSSARDYYTKRKGYLDVEIIE